MDKRNETLGSRIKAARRAMHMSQTELGRRIDKTLRTVQKYEIDEIEPSLSMVEEIGRVLNVSPLTLLGYDQPKIEIRCLSDVVAALYEINKRAGIRFEIDVKKPPKDGEWSCALRFDGNDRDNPHNADMCQMLERFADERHQVETYWSDARYFDHWVETELAYYAGILLPERPQEELTDEERMERRNQILEESMKKGEAEEAPPEDNT